MDKALCNGKEREHNAHDYQPRPVDLHSFQHQRNRAADRFSGKRRNGARCYRESPHSTFVNYRASKRARAPLLC